MATKDTPISVHCTRRDARCNGARLLRALRAAGTSGPYFLYGDERAAVACAGAREFLSIMPEGRAEAWSLAGDFLARQIDRCVFG